jgi:hypothetical protein
MKQNKIPRNEYIRKPVGKTNPYKEDIDYVSTMGYRDDSPFTNRAYIDIHTPNGMIDMSNTGSPLMANGMYLPPYSGMYNMGTSHVREIPMAQEGEEFSDYRRPGPLATGDPRDSFGYVTGKTAAKKSLPVKKGITKTPEEWEKEIRAVEKRIGDPSTWTLDSYKILQDKLNEYKAWRENTPEGKTVVDHHNEPGEYEVPLPSHLKNNNQQPVYLPAAPTYISGKDQNSLHNTNPEEWLRQNFLAKKNAEKNIRVGDFIAKASSYLPGSLGAPGTAYSVMQNLEEKDYPGTFYELLSTLPGAYGYIGKGLGLYNDLTEEAYGGDPSLPNIEGHYPFGGQNTKTHTHMQEGGWLDA